MLINNFDMTVGEAQVTIKNANPEILQGIIQALQSVHNGQAVTAKEQSKAAKTGQNRPNKFAFKNNYQFQDYFTPTNFINREKAINHELVSMSISNGKPLKEGSKQLTGKRKLIATFLAANNSPQSFEALLSAFDFLTSEGAVRNYLSQLVRAGVVAKDSRNDMFFISDFFINKLK